MEKTLEIARHEFPCTFYICSPPLRAFTPAGFLALHLQVKKHRDIRVGPTWGWRQLGANLVVDHELIFWTLWWGFLSTCPFFLGTSGGQERGADPAAGGGFGPRGGGTGRGGTAWRGESGPGAQSRLGGFERISVPQNHGSPAGLPTSFAKTTALSGLGIIVRLKEASTI